ncbi:MAG: hypothetical protein CW345_06435 [Firmicutes bacterium]|nr:hypothetical protein [Bacillota bacterium]MBO2521424.1 hypothetical protein [Bacillota bacterium]
MVRPIRPRDDFRAALHIRRELRKLRPDLVSTHSSKAGLLGRIAARSLGLPAIFTAHGWAFTEGVPDRQRRLYVHVERIAARLCDRIITVSNYDKKLALQHRIAPVSKVVCIHNGMPDIPSQGMARPEIDPPRIVMVAIHSVRRRHLPTSAKRLLFCVSSISQLRRLANPLSEIFQTLS